MAKTIRFDSKFRIIVQYSIQFEMKKHYSHSNSHLLREPEFAGFHTIIILELFRQEFGVLPKTDNAENLVKES